MKSQPGAISFRKASVLSRSSWFEALTLLLDHRPLVVGHGALEVGLGLLERADARIDVRDERVVRLDGRLLVRRGLGDVLGDVVLDELQDGDDAVVLALGTAIAALERGRRRGRRLTGLNERLLLHAANLRQREAVLLVEAREHADGLPHELHGLLVVGLRREVLSVLLRPLVTGSSLLRLEIRNLILDLLDLLLS